MPVSDPFEPYTAPEIEAMGIGTRGVRDGEHPTETRQINASTARRKFFCLWDQREDFIRYMLGDVAVWNDAGTLRLTRLLPQRMPDNDEIAAVQLESMTGHAFLEMDVDGMPVYQQAECVFLYEHVPFRLTEDEDAHIASDGEFSRYTWEIPGEGKADALTMPGSILQYIVEGGGAEGSPPPHRTSIPYNLNKVIPTQAFSIKWIRLPEEAWEPDSPLYNRVYLGEDGSPELIPFLGCINTEVFNGCEVGTVLFDSVMPVRNRSVLGEGWQIDLEYRFIFKPQGWNWCHFFPSRAQAAYQGIYFVGKGTDFYTADLLPDNYSLYNARDLNRLFTVVDSPP